MHGKARQGLVRQSPPVAATFGYAQVETALARIYESEDVQRTAFRARLKHFRKLGLPQRQPGKGARLRYTASDIFQLVLACEFAEFGIDPHLITQIIRRHWRLKGSLWQAFNLTQQPFSDTDFLVTMEARFMSWVWNREKSKQTATEISTSTMAEPVFIRVIKTSDSKALLDELPKPGRRLLVFNLSARVRAVEKALAQQQMK
jgi:hypothetical protein